MKIGLAPFEFKNNDIEFNMSQIEKALEKSEKVDILCFGETFLQGFDSLNWDYENDKEVAVTQDNARFEKLKELSLMYETALLFGYIEKENETLYSSCAVIARGSVIYNYRRISRGWKEFDITDEHYQEGTEVGFFSFKGHDVTIALCGDMWDMPERFKTEDVLIWPVYVNFSLEEWKQYKVEYAEQANFAARRVLMINSISKNPDSHGGAFYFKDGAIEAQMEFDREKILVVEV